MNKKDNPVITVLKCIAIVVFLLVLSCVLATLPAFRGKNLRVPYDKSKAVAEVIDDRELFTNKQIKELNSALLDCSHELEMNVIVFVSGSAISDDDTADFAIRQYDSEVGKENVDGVVLYLDFSGKRPAYDTISGIGKAGIIFDKKEREAILDEVGAYLPSSDVEPDPAMVKGAIEQFCLILETHNDNYKTEKLHYEKDEYMKLYFFDTGDDFYVTKQMAPGALFVRFIISFGLGCIVAFIIYFVTKHRYKFKNKTNPSVYVSSDKTFFSQRTDTFIRTYTTKHRIDSGSSGGGHHHSGGGHRSGGCSSGRHR